MNTPQAHSNVWLRLALPATFGVIAAFSYWSALSSQLKPVYFAQLKVSKKPGEILSQGDLQPVAISGSTDQLAAGVLSWDHRGSAEGVKADRLLRKGQLLLKSDIRLDENVDPLRDGERDLLIRIPDDVIVDDLDVGMDIDFRVQGAGNVDQVGPFRVLQIWKSARSDSSMDDNSRIDRIRIAYVPYEDGSLETELEAVMSLLSDKQRNRIARVYSIQPHHHPGE